MERALVLLVGCGLDLLFGDPRWMPHPVVAMGRAIAALEKGLRRIFPATPRGEFWAGVVLAALLPLLSFFIAFALLWLAGLVHPLVRLALECFLCYQILAGRSLWRAGMAVYEKLAAGDLPGARLAVGRVVGRQTEGLSEGEVTRATVETLAENTSDGIVAPLLFLLLGGVPLALAYKAVNTMDSMVGYKNERYLYFGRAAARLDDGANYIPARLTALLMAAGAGLAGLSVRGAMRVWRRDGKNHASPNAGHPESACAGALGVRLGGDSVYFGERMHKPTLGDAARPLEAGDIRRAIRLSRAAAGLGLVLCCGVALSAALLFNLALGVWA